MNDIKLIETAPKDVDILAWFPELGWMVTSFCDYDSANNAGGWVVGFDYYGPPPTHWTSLPPEPTDNLIKD